MTWPIPLILIILCHLHFSTATHIKGTWQTSSQRVKVLAKFGFQQVSTVNRENTRGFVFGNVTSSSSKNQNSVLLSLVQESKINAFLFDSSNQYGESCSSMLKDLTSVGFEARCLNEGQRSDIFRWVPCPKDTLCADEDDPKTVVAGNQLTFQIDEQHTAEYWYLVLVGCVLDSNCTWVTSTSDDIINYDLWLVNGKPYTEGASFTSHQFSFDEQDSLQLYSIALAVYLLLCIIVNRAHRIGRHSEVPMRIRILTYIIQLRTVGLALQCMNVALFAADGEGLLIARIIGELIREVGVQTTCMLLLMLSRGWAVSTRSSGSSSCFRTTFAIFATIHAFFFLCNLIFMYDAMHEIDLFSSWPGYGMLLIRCIYTAWFLIEIRVSITKEQDPDTAEFLAHTGAGLLVWLIYLPVLGVVASFISQLWRFKIILGITLFADITVQCCLIHLFWPNSSYRKFFVDNMNSHRRMDRTDSHELADYERLLFETSDTELDYPEPDMPQPSIHNI